jgi:hypothetical protein
VGNARQLLERHRERALTAIAERLAGTGLELADLRDLIGEVLARYGESCAQVPFDCDTAEMPIGVWDDTTEPIGVHNR